MFLLCQNRVGHPAAMLIEVWWACQVMEGGGSEDETTSPVTVYSLPHMAWMARLAGTLPLQLAEA